jgi:predicted RNase H-like HicB family nuclease
MIPIVCVYIHTKGVEMTSVAYIAVVERGEHGFGVFFPDVPGCVSAGRTEQEAFANAEEALSGHLAEMLLGGDDLPEPSSDIPSDPDVDEHCRLLVRVELPGKAVRLNITMDEGLVAAIDRVASNRSSFLADAARAALAARRVRARA